MKYTFKLNEQDYLTHQLFIGSTSEPILKRRRKQGYYVTATLLIVSFGFYVAGNNFMTYYCLAFAVVSWFAFPFYMRHKYRKHYERHVQENQSELFGVESTLEFGEEKLKYEDACGSNGEFSYSLFRAVNELPNHFLIAIKGGQSLILPKRHIDNPDDFQNEMIALSSRLGIEFSDYSKWKWK